MKIFRLKLQRIPVVLAVLLVLLSTRASAGEPKVLEVPFYREAVALPPEVMGDLVQTLMALANGYPEFNKSRPRFRNKALAVAVAIDPDVLVNSIGGAASNKRIGPKIWLKGLWESAERIHSTAFSNDERLLALYLMGVVDGAVEEGAPAYKQMRNLLKTEKFKGWEKITGEKRSAGAKAVSGEKLKAN